MKNYEIVEILKKKTLMEITGSSQTLEEVQDLVVKTFGKRDIVIYITESKNKNVG